MLVLLLDGFYRCAYKKPRTKLMMIYVTCYVPLLLVTLPLQYLALSKIASSPYQSFFYYTLVSVIINTSLDIWHGILSWKMRAINIKMQEALILESLEFKQTKSLLEQTNSLEELEQLFAQALKKRTKKFKNVLKNFYFQRKCALQSSLQNPAD